MVLDIKTNFTSGQISENLFGRGDLSLYDNGAKTLTNVTIAPTGGVSRRNGTKYVAPLLGSSKLIEFEFNTEQVYLLAFSDKKVQVFKNDELITTLDSPFEQHHLNKLNYTQSADTLLIVHEDIHPQQITRNHNDVWNIEPWKFYEKDGQVFCPYFNFFKKTETIKPSATSGFIILNAINNIFSNKYIGSRIRINGGELLITEYIDEKNIKGNVSKALSNINANNDWLESSFSNLRGWPRSVTFHQGRTVIGGSKSLPNRLWLSVSSDLFNFNLGTGLDDEAIEFAILSDQINAIENVISTRHLLVLTTGAEWMVTGEPLSPISMKLNQQTKVGSYSKTNMMPQNIDGASIFVSSNGRQLREFLFSDVEQAYQGKDLTLMAPDIIKSPMDFAFDKNKNILYIVLEDGTISAYTSYRTEEVSGWSKIKTNGSYCSIAIVGTDIYFCVTRGQNFYLEKEDTNFFTDCSFENNYEQPQNQIQINPLFEGKEIRVLADDFDIGIYEVINNNIELIHPAQNLKYGLEYEHIIEPLPYTMVSSTKPFSPNTYRVIGSLFRIINSKTLRLSFNNKYVEVPLSKLNSHHLMDSAPKSYSGDVEIKSVGWIRNLNQPMWSIHGVEPYPFTLLSAINQIKPSSKGE